MTINAEPAVASLGSDRDLHAGPTVLESGLTAPPKNEVISAAGRRGAEEFEHWATVIPPGATLAGRYRIDWFIARGGMGEVYAAFDRELGDRIALKTMTSALAGDPEGLSALKAEVSLSRKVSHTNVCRIHDLGVHSVAGYPNLMFLTMEFVEGESLAARLQREGALSEAEAVQFASGILAGLAAAHEAGVLHRDLKSDNIMLRKRPGGGVTPVIMDFGLASALNPNSSRISGDQALVGSLGYMAPEQVQGDVLRAVTDVYSLGVILFEMLTGRLPFRASTPALTALKRLQEPAPSLRSIDPNLSPGVERIVALALQPRPRDRYRSALAMLHDLESLPCYRRSMPPALTRGAESLEAGLGAAGSIRASQPEPQSSDSLAAAFDSALREPAGEHAPVPGGTNAGSEPHTRWAASDPYMRRELEVTLLSGLPGMSAPNWGQGLASSGQHSSPTEGTGTTSLPPYVALATPRRRAPGQLWTVAMLTGGAALAGVLWLVATSDRKAQDQNSAGRVSIGADAYREVTPVVMDQPLTVVQPAVATLPRGATTDSDGTPVGSTSKTTPPQATSLIDPEAGEPRRNSVVSNPGRARAAGGGAGADAVGAPPAGVKSAVVVVGFPKPAVTVHSAPRGSLAPGIPLAQAEVAGRTAAPSDNPAVTAAMLPPNDRPKKPTIAYPPELRPQGMSGAQPPLAPSISPSGQPLPRAATPR